jgi:putative RNA 2'-phosphotransferase
MKDGIPKELEADYNNYFKMEERYDKMKKIDNTRIGKKISYLLRHNPDGLQMDENGWVNVRDLLYKLSISRSKLDEIVNTNNKKRYTYNIDKSKIRANQGHSINVDVELEEKEPLTVLYHGTSPDNLKSIMKFGLNKMNRNHVHLSDEKETAMNVGKRHSKDKKPFILIINSKKMYDDGYKFFISKNGVWLTDHVPEKYITYPTYI